MDYRVPVLMQRRPVFGKSGLLYRSIPIRGACDTVLQGHYTARRHGRHCFLHHTRLEAANKSTGKTIHFPAKNEGLFEEGTCLTVTGILIGRFGAMRLYRSFLPWAQRGVGLSPWLLTISFTITAISELCGQANVHNECQEQLELKLTFFSCRSL